MTLAVTIGVTVAIAIFALAGAVRDLPRGILVLAGVLLAAALVSFWAAPIATDFAQRLANPDRALLRRFTSISIFSLATLLGFGSGMLLPRTKTLTASTRFAGTVLGAFSGVLAVGYVLRYASEENPTFLAEVRASPLGGPLHDQLPLVLAGAAVLLGIAVVAVIFTRLFTRRPAAPNSNTASQPATGSKPAPSQQPSQQKVLDKMNERLKP